MSFKASPQSCLIRAISQDESSIIKESELGYLTEKTIQAVYYVTMTRSRITIVAVEKQ
jgi:hypothetical protein